jgi:Tfp pilus assembly protein PilF
MTEKLPMWMAFERRERGALARSLEIQPDSPLAVYNLGLVHLNSGNKSEALQYFTRYKRDYAQNLSKEELKRLKALIQKCTSES